MQVSTRSSLRKAAIPSAMLASLRVLLGAFIALLMVAGCSSTVTPVSGIQPEELVGLLPASAFVHGDALYVRYAHSGRETVLVAAWPGDEPGESLPYRVARLDVLSPDVRLATLERDGRTVRLFSLQEWDDLLRAVLARLAPASPDEAALAVVQGVDIAVSRAGPQGVVLHPLEQKPARLRVTRRIDDAELARAMQREAVARYGDRGPLVFQVSAGTEGRSFVLFDPGRQLSVLIMPDSLPPGRSLQDTAGLALTMTDALVIRSHLLAPLTQPLSSLARLTWLTLQTAVGAIPRAHAWPSTPPPPAAPGAPMDAEELERELDAMFGATRIPGTIEPLIDGSVFYPRLVQAIQDARESVRLRLYIFDVDEVAVRFADLLKQRSAEVEVQVLLDQLGTAAAARVPPAFSYGSSSAATPDSITHYLTDGSNVTVRSGVNTWLTSDHTKTIVVDRNVAYLGGMNIGYEYRYDWHDMMVELHGPIVARLARDFDLAWAQAALGGDLARLGQSLRTAPSAPPAPAGTIQLRTLYTKPGMPEIRQAQLAAMRRARSHIYVEQAYMSDDEMIEALVAARRRGVDVRVVLPTSGDSGFMNAANLVAANVFVRNGVRVYAYRGMTHVKAALYDGWACLGSANFDKLSLLVNLETDIATSDPAFVSRLRQELFERDFAQSKEITEARPLGWSTYMSSFIARQL
jgi:cardiolipin synthase